MILVAAVSIDDWMKQLADPSDRPRRGDSTRALAARWHGRTRFPDEISELLSGEKTTRDATLLLAIPEHQVPLVNGARASHVNLWLLARTRCGLLSVVIDAIGADGFDSRVDERGGEKPNPKLWAALCHFLEIEPSSDDRVHSRLLHRTSSALLEARRFFARGAAIIVQSFSQGRDGFGDFQQFVRVMGGVVRAPGELVAVAPREGIELFFGWAQAG